MRTYTHGLIGYILYWKGTPEEKKIAVLGAMLPDLFLAIGFIFHFGQSPAIKFLHGIFHHSILQSLTELFHSFILIIPLLLLSWYWYKRVTPFFVGMLSHAVLDLLTHQQWAYNHLYPFAVSPIQSVISYTSLWFTVLEHVAVVSILFYLVYRFKKGTLHH